MHPARRLAAAIEPVVGQVYFAPECHQRYERLGFDASRRELDGVAMPDGPAYFTSRGSLLGQVPGQVVAAAFGVFNPEVVVPFVALGWSRTDAATICATLDSTLIVARLALSRISCSFIGMGLLGRLGSRLSDERSHGGLLDPK